MHCVLGKLPTTNPFASACVRPGALPFVFPAGVDATVLVDRLRANAWRGQIIGPHGTGKSTLLHALAPAIAAAGRNVHWLRPPGCLVVSEETTQKFDRNAPTLLVIDGFEQFSPWSRWWRKFGAQRDNAGLLVTAHCDMGLPMLYETQVDEALAQRLVATLVDGQTNLIDPRDVAQALREHQGNLRDALFALYDVYERRKS
jgi:hypothetical protein